MVQFLSINFFLGFLQFLLGFSKVPVFCVTLYKWSHSATTCPIPTLRPIKITFTLNQKLSRTDHSPQETDRRPTGHEAVQFITLFTTSSAEPQLVPDEPFPYIHAQYLKLSFLSCVQHLSYARLQNKCSSLACEHIYPVERYIILTHLEVPTCDLFVRRGRFPHYLFHGYQILPVS